MRSADFCVWHYNCGETEPRKGLTGHYHSTHVTLIAWWASSLHPLPPSLSPSPFPHIPVFISFLSPPDFFYFFFCLSGEQTRAERRETHRDKEEAKDDKNKLEYGNGQTDLSKKREAVCLSSLEVFVITGPCLYEQNGFGQRIHLEYVLPALEHFSLSSH